MNQTTGVADAVLQYIRTQLTPEAPGIGPDSMLFSEGYLDSTAMLELILWIGDSFDITIQNEDLTPDNFATVRNIVDFVQRCTSSPRTVEGDAAAVVGND